MRNRPMTKTLLSHNNTTEFCVETVQYSRVYEKISFENIKQDMSQQEVIYERENSMEAIAAIEKRIGGLDSQGCSKE